MSGSNLNMSLVTNVATAIDGTDTSLSPFNWTCPDVDPHSDIYFYQFSQFDLPDNKTWTESTLQIASKDGNVTAPEFAAQPSGDPPAWGNGKLASVEEAEVNQDPAPADASTTDSAQPDATSMESAPTSSQPEEHRATRTHTHDAESPQTISAEEVQPGPLMTLPAPPMTGPRIFNGEAEDMAPATATATETVTVTLLVYNPTPLTDVDIPSNAGQRAHGQISRTAGFAMLLLLGKMII